MADPITATRAKRKFACGNDFTNLTVINFVGPEDSRACAYSCNMNVDCDGDSQAYGPLKKPELRPKDNLGNAGWKSERDNAAIRQKYEAGKKALNELEQKRVDLLKRGTVVPNSAKSASVLVKGASNPTAALDEEITKQKAQLRRWSFEHTDPNNPSGGYNEKYPNPKNFEKIFWYWYGVVALTPGEAQKMPPYLDMPALTLALRKPKLDQTSYYEDVYGRFPVVQSVFEPGPDYFVSPLPERCAPNKRFPSWDQRHFIPNDAFDQQPFGALSGGLIAETGLSLNDMVFAIRLDTTDTLSFPFRDRGNGYMVAECSFAAFTGLGGVYLPEKEGAAKFRNNFPLLYLAFPHGQDPASTLAKFSTASNASDFPIILSFIAQATAGAKANKKGTKFVSGDPLTAFGEWKKSKSTSMPKYFDVIVEGLSPTGIGSFVQRMMRRHSSLLSGGPWLQLKS